MTINELIEQLVDMANEKDVPTDDDIYVVAGGQSFAVESVQFNETVGALEIVCD